MAISFGNRPRIRFQTSHGNFTVEVDTDRAPATAENFLQYVKDGFYNNTLIHRVVDNFIIQGGGFEPGMIQKTTRPPIKNEAEQGMRNERGTMAMARVADEPDSATSQFFINTRDNDILNHAGTYQPGYCAFGRVLEGMEVVERIEGVVTQTVGDHQNVPLQEIVVQQVTVEAVA
ncbi:MAG: peptidylprolyl isomerase [Gammaproteobacteria bacterium]|nr:peptidylprolyl isomerase [Gammaproteobacteria bacterium]